MNDLDLVREMRADVPSPTRARLAPGRARLLASISRQSRPRQLRRAMLPIGLAAAAAAIASAAILGSGTGAAVRAAPGTRLTLTAHLLRTASVTVARHRTVRPARHQWFYTKLVQSSYGQPTQSDENWMTFDGGQTAYFQSGQMIVHTTLGDPGGGGRTALGKYDADATPLTAYNALESLPSSPSALLAVAARQAARLGANGAPGSIVSLYAPASRAELEFDYLAQLLWNAATGAPPRAEAAVFRAMAAIRGVSSQPGITDASGRPAIGLSADGGKTQLLVDPRTYQVIGMREISTGEDPVRTPEGGKAPWPAKGVVVTSIAWAQVTTVSGPGRR